MKRTLLTTALMASGAALLIAASPKADLNQDGQVTRAEFTQTAVDRFTVADTNGDNLLSEDERKALKQARRDKRESRKFERLDTDKDGSISRAEMDEKRNAQDVRKAERRAEILEKFDTNLDGQLSETERTAMQGEFKKGRDAKRGDKKSRRADRPKPDANEDGFVSLEEHIAVSDQLFVRMDANGDGVLVKGEGGKRKGQKGRRKMQGEQ